MVNFLNVTFPKHRSGHVLESLPSLECVDDSCHLQVIIHSFSQISSPFFFGSTFSHNCSPTFPNRGEIHGTQASVFLPATLECLLHHSRRKVDAYKKWMSFS